LKLKKAHYIVLGFVIVLTVVLLRLPGRTTSSLKLAWGGAFLPLFGLSGASQQLAHKAGQAVLPREGLSNDNEQLRRENAELKMRVLQADATLRENDRLRTALGWPKTTPWKIKLAPVIARDPANWWRNIHIGLGQRDGLRVDLPVLTPDGLVGRVTEVGEARSRVVLLGDPNCRVAALVLEGRQSVDNGVVSEGSSVVDPSLVELSYLSRTSGLKPGQMIVTSGLGGVFPKGITIGHLVDFRSIEYGLYTKARVKLAVNLNELEEVWVMLL